MHKHLDLPQPFADLGLEPPILEALVAINFREPSEIQKAMIPHVLAGRDIMGQARTGTGKTAAFGLPILQMIDTAAPLQALVLCPTRELAAQAVGEFRRFAKMRPIHCVPVYGGHGLAQQLHQLGRKPHVAIGTPGRVLDLLGREALQTNHVRFIVLDEVDRMLDIGFRDDIKRILSRFSTQRQTILVSATISPEIKRLAQQYMRDPVEVNVSGDDLTVESVDQFFVSVEPWDKYRALKLFLQQEKPKLMIVFTNTKHGARKLAKRLFADGIEAKEIHGDLVQQKREKVMERFRRHQIPILVATDLASRGIDVSAVTHIVNYDLPQDTEVYVHRVGRTARMGAVGRAVTFVTREQGSELTKIEMLINKELSRLEIAGFKPSPPPRGEFGVPGPVEPNVAPVVIQQPERPVPATLGGRFKPARRRRL